MGMYDSYQNQVLEASLWLSGQGYFGPLRGTGGNVSLRISGEELMAVTPSSLRYQDIGTDDICIADFSGRLVRGLHAPSVEAGLHGALYRHRRDINAVVHTHQTYGSVFAVLNLPIPALFDEMAFLLGESVEVIPYALSGSTELVDNVVSMLGNNAGAYIMQNHGILALGRTMDEALLCAELVEKAAHIYCLALSAGEAVTTLPDSTGKQARSLREKGQSRTGEGRNRSGCKNGSS